jgi:hypothetical protein
MMLFVFAALVALVASQCNPEGNTYRGADLQSLTFGAAVGDWVPGLIDMGTVNTVHFTVWKQATPTRWEVTEFGTSSSESSDEHCILTGQYNIDFFNGCTDMHVTLLSDSCHDRAAFLQNTFTLWERADDATCYEVGTALDATLGESEAVPFLSGDDATYVFGQNEFALVSVEDRAVIVQRWRVAESGHTTEVIDFASYPAGFACPLSDVGSYVNVAVWGDECQVRFCGVVDSCLSRSQLLHNTAFNGYEEDICTADAVDNGSEPARTECSVDGRQWLLHPDDCVNQNVEGGCAFCSGIAMQETAMWCINRQGAGCNQIFESAVRQTYCNLEFECPASTVSISFVLFISTLLALFFH